MDSVTASPAVGSESRSILRRCLEPCSIAELDEGGELPGATSSARDGNQKSFTAAGTQRAQACPYFRQGLGSFLVADRRLDGKSYLVPGSRRRG